MDAKRVTEILNRMTIEQEKYVARFDKMKRELNEMLQEHIIYSGDVQKVVVLNACEKLLLAHINRKQGRMASDILTASDISEHMYIVESHMRDAFTPHRVGVMLGRIGRFSKTRAVAGKFNQRVWVLRNHTNYVYMTSKQIADEYFDGLNLPPVVVDNTPPIIDSAPPTINNNPSFM